jgi:hypothetical protein
MAQMIVSPLLRRGVYRYLAGAKYAQAPWKRILHHSGAANSRPQANYARKT